MPSKNVAHSDCLNCASRKQSIFCDLDNKTMEVVNDAKRCILYTKGQHVFHEGAFPHGLYCVHNGKIKITKLSAQGKEQITRLARSGDLLGYRSLLANEPYNASAVTLEDASICFVPKQVFLTLVEKNQKLSQRIIKLLTHDLAHAESSLTHMAQHTIRERVAEALVLLKETFGLEADGETIAVHITREEVANLAGTATESAIRMLSEMNKEHIIDLSGKKIKIKNLAALVHTANLED